MGIGTGGQSPLQNDYLEEPDALIGHVRISEGAGQ